MKAIKALAIVLLLATTSQAKGKVQYDVCAVDPGGKVGVYEVSDKQSEALTLARYLERKTGRHYFVVVEELTAKGDSK